MSRRTQLIIGIVVIIIIIIIIVILHFRRKSDVKKIAAKIKDITDQSGTSADLAYSNAFDPNFWKTKEAGNGLSVYTYESTKSEANKLRVWIGRLYSASDEKAIVAWFQKVPSKAHISRVCELYISLFKRPLFDDLKTIDYGILGISLDEDVMPQIQAIVNAKPNYVK